MKKFKLRLIILGVLCTPSIFLAQTKNSISFQTGLFHYSFDKSPIMNINYPTKYNNQDVFNGLFLNSIGIEYTRQINDKSCILINFFSFRQNYSKYFKNSMPKPVIGWRYFSTIGLNYSRKIRILEKINFNYGCGINFRYGEEAVIISRFIIGEFNGQPVYELLIENIRRNDIGINSFIGIEYSPLKGITLFSKIDFLGFVYINDKEQKDDMKNVYNSPQYPSRFDLSLKLGIGFNF